MPDSAIDTLPLFEHRTGSRGAPPGTRISFNETVRTFANFGQSSMAIQEGEIPYLVNEFWTSGQRQAHSIHEVSYRACFKPQLPEFFIARLTEPGDTVYDPFMGRGTTLVQAALMGRRPVGNDINPLSVMLTRPRLRPPTLADIAARLQTVPWADGMVQDEALLAFYSTRTLAHLDALRTWLLERASVDRNLDPVDDWIRMVAINRLTGHSPGFFSVYTLPPNQAVSANAQRKINEQRSQTPPDRDIPKLILKKSRSLLSDGPMGPHPDALLVTTSAEATPAIADASIQLVVTSPPFLDIVQYAEDNWQEMVRNTLTELARVVRPGGHVAFEVGEVRGGKVLLERLVWEAAKPLPFERLFVMVNQQEFTKTANCWGVRNNTKGTNTNRIVMLKRVA
jgi:hypothetical protein